MDSNSLQGLIDELETIIQPRKFTQTTPRQKIYSKDYLYQRLYQSNEKSKRARQHSDTKEEKKKNDNKTAQNLNYHQRNCKTQKSPLKSRNFVKENRQLSHKNKINPICNKEVLRKEQNERVNILKPISKLKIQSQTPEENNQQLKVKYISSAREKNTVISKYKPPEECGNNIEISNFTHNRNKKKSLPEFSVKSDQALLSHVSSLKDESKENSSQVKQLTSYWNNLLNNQQHMDSKDFVSSRNLSETNVCGNSFSADLNIESKFDSEIKYIISSSINDINSEEEFRDHLKTDIEMMQINNNNTLELFSISPHNIDYINILWSNEGVLCRMAETLFTESTGIHFWNRPQRLDDRNAIYSRKLYSKVLKTTEIDDFQTMESNFELEGNKKTLKIVAMHGINLNKVKKALIIFQLYKEYTRMKTFLNNVLLPVFTREIYKKIKYTSPGGSEGKTALGEKEIDDDNKEQDDFEDDNISPRYHTKQFLLSIATTLKSVVDSVLDKVVLYGPSIERFLRGTYQFFVSLLVFRIIIMDAFQK